MYVLLSGYLPFQGENRNAVFNKISKANYHFNHKEFQMVSEEGKNLIRKMLVVDPDHRITPTMALKDVWFTKNKSGDTKGEAEKGNLDPDIFNKLKEYKGVSTLKKVALNILVKMTADSKDVEQLREAFMKIDKDSTGYISPQELKSALDEAGL